MTTTSKRVGANPEPLAHRHADIVAETHLLRLRQGELFRKARKKAGLSIDALAAKCGLHFNTIGRIERAESETNLEQLLLVAKMLEIPCASLMLGSGQSTPIESLADETEFVKVDVLDVEVCAGPDAVNERHQVIGHVTFGRRWLASRAVKPENAKIVRARGQSMADKINHGDFVLADTAVRQFETDGIYLVEMDGFEYVKLLQRNVGTGAMDIISYNSAYRTHTVLADRLAEVRISGRVVWHAGEL